MKILMLLLLPFFSIAQIKPVYKNLALEGGGLRGIAYAGAFKAFETFRLKLDQVWATAC